MSAVIVSDLTAASIGQLFRQAKTTHIDSVRYLAECGRQLAMKREHLEHGDWMQWLKENEQELGFSYKTAQRMLRIDEDRTLASNLSEEKALDISRSIWGHTQNVYKPRTPVARTSPPVFPDSTDVLLSALSVLMEFAEAQGGNLQLDITRVRAPLQRAHHWLGEVLQAI